MSSNGHQPADDVDDDDKTVYYDAKLAAKIQLIQDVSEYVCMVSRKEVILYITTNINILIC